MKNPPLKKLIRADSIEGVEDNLLKAGFTLYDGSGVTLFTVFKGRERHTRYKKLADSTYVKLQSYTNCEGAEDKIFIAVSHDGAGKKKLRQHISCEVYIRQLTD